jgi:glycosyltransferase involved in cell wall biosynthesis
MTAAANVQTQFPLVSVVMATYNGERFLKEQLDSIISQTYPNLEIIVVDDASKDGTLAILESYAQAHSNLHVYKAEQNLGYIRNFEKGMRLCRGEYIALSDQDDIWLPEKISTLMRVRGDHALIYCNSELIDAEGNSLGFKLTDIKNLLSFHSPFNYITGNTASGHAMIIKREVVEYALPLPGMVTHDYWIGFISTLFSPLKFVDEALVRYRQHGGNVVGVNSGSTRATKKRKATKAERNDLARQRMKLMYEKCPAHQTEIKKVFYSLNKSYENFSLGNNFTRMMLFFKYRKEITAYKKRNELRRWLFCLKMFFKVE